MATASQISISTEARKHSFLTKGCNDYTQEQHESRVIKLSGNTTIGLQLFSDTSSSLVNYYSQISRDPKALQIGTEEAEMQKLPAVMWAGSTFTQVNTCPK